MRLGITKIDQQTIAEILGDMPLETLDDLGTGGLVGAYYLPQIFGIELAGECGRIHKVTEQYGELPALSLWGGVIGRKPCPLNFLGIRKDKRRRGRRQRSKSEGCTR